VYTPTSTNQGAAAEQRFAKTFQYLDVAGVDVVGPWLAIHASQTDTISIVR
jgi:hypothetical protein